MSSQTNFSDLVNESRAILVNAGLVFVGGGSVISGVALLVARGTAASNLIHVAAMLLASASAFISRARIIGSPSANERSFIHLMVLSTTVYVPNMVGYALYPYEDHERTLIVMGILFGAACMSAARFAGAYAFWITGWYIVSFLIGRTIDVLDVFYLWFFTPSLGLLGGYALVKFLRGVYELRLDVDRRERELSEARKELVAEQQRRAEEEARRQNIEQIIEHQNEQLRHVDRTNTMGEMVASIAHEINQPLNAMGMYSGLLLLEKTDDEGRRVAAREINSLVDRCGKIIHRLRKFVRRDNSDAAKVCMRQVVKDSIALVANSARRQDRRIHFECSLDENSSEVLANEIQMQQVVVNLLQNAIESMIEAGGDDDVIEVKLTSDDSFVTIAVSDTGTGIAADADRVFEAFHSTKTGGMGMGLAICRSIVERYNGSITCENNEVAGATFTFRLPIDGSAKSAINYARASA